jgi:DedD protein
MPSTTSDDGFHEIQLNGKQLVFLFMAVTVVSVVIFLCGVLVGRGVRAERGPVEPVMAEQQLMTAPDDLAPAAAEVVPNAPATAQEDLTYSDRLTGAEQPREELQTPSPTAETTAARRQKGRAATPATVDVAATARTEAAPATRADASRALSEPAGAGYAIQLAALRQREEAESMARRLTGKGYQAYVVSPSAGAPAMYRVRVGKFKERREAETVAARLQKEEQFKPWIVP